MKPRFKSRRMVAALVATALIVASVYIIRGWCKDDLVIVLKNGATVRIVGVNVGTNHIYGSWSGKMAEHLPESISRPLTRFLGTRPNKKLVTGNTNLVLWLEIAGEPESDQTYMTGIRRPAERNSRNLSFTWFDSPGGQSSRVQSVTFKTWPRRTKKIAMDIFDRPSSASGALVGTVEFENPSYVSSPQTWKPAPLPSTKSVGDLKVKLIGFASGLSPRRPEIVPQTPDDVLKIIYHRADAFEEPRALITLSYELPKGVLEDWTAYDITLCDYSGNEQSAVSKIKGGKLQMILISPLLWSDEEAWKIRLHLKRQSGFTPDELITFTNIPIPSVGTTNALNQTNTVDGITTVLRTFARNPNVPDGAYNHDTASKIRFDYSDLNGTNLLEVVRVTARPKGETVSLRSAVKTENYHEFQMWFIPTNATHLDITLSLQQPRDVEFNVAPNWITNDYVVPLGNN